MSSKPGLVGVRGVERGAEIIGTVMILVSAYVSLISCLSVVPQAKPARDSQKQHSKQSCFQRAASRFIH
jgi:hypothetical protein